MSERTSVVNIRKEACDVFMGRPSLFGNPFHIGRDGTRAVVVFKHFLYFHRRLASDPEFKLAVLSLKGKKLGCFCHSWDGTGENPLYCHCDTIADYLNGIQDATEN